MTTAALSKTLEVSREVGTRTIARGRQVAVSTREVYWAEPVAVVNVVRLALLCGMTFGAKLTPAQVASTMALLEAGLTLWQRRTVSPVRFRNERRRADPAP